jgi:DNA-binding GntR family transcriptional regulator
VRGSNAAWAATATVKGYGVTTAQLKDWSIMTKSNGVTMDYTPTNTDIGIFMRDVVSNDLGEVNDIFIFDGGTEHVLGPQGYYAEIDENHPELKLWKRTPDSWKRSDFLRANGKQYGVPVIGNGDCFGYFPKPIDANPNGQDEIPWTTFYEGEKVKGRVAIDRSWLQSMSEAANCLKYHNKVKLEDRDAVGRLVAASALEMVPGRSIRVPVLTRKQADEIWSMRLLLEGEAAARYAARKPGAEVRLLFEHTRTLRSLRYGIDVEATMRSLMDWNDDLRRGLDAPILLDMISRIYLLSAPFIAQAFTMPVPHGENFVQFTIQIQDELILAIEQGDAEAARHLRCADLRSFQRYIYSRHGW